MTDTNGLRLSLVRAVNGVTPTTPRMRTLRLTGETLRADTEYSNSEELRDDRMESDAFATGEVNDGGLALELSYPPDRSALSQVLEGVFYNNWRLMPQHYNDGTADSVITGITGSTGTFTVIDESGSGGFSGSAYRTGMLLYASGLTVSSRLLRAGVGTSTTIVVGASTGLVDEAAPGAEARIKVVGFQGAAGDITATATGLGSTVLDFTVMGLAVGQWVKISGEGGDFSFATAALNTWARITAIATNALTLDNLPAAWATDSGTGKTIRVYAGDYLRNGTVKLGHTIERGFMLQAVPSYVAHPNMFGGQAVITFTPRRQITLQLTMMGTTGTTDSTTSLDAAPDPAPDVAAFPVFACGANVGKVIEAGSILSAPNWCRSMTITLNNNLRNQDAIDTFGAAAIGVGTASVGVAAETYFGDLRLRNKTRNGTPTSFSLPLIKANRGMVFTMPRQVIGGGPTNPARNQDTILSLTGRASRDPLTACHIQMDRLEWVV